MAVTHLGDDTDSAAARPNFQSVMKRLIYSNKQCVMDTNTGTRPVKPISTSRNPALQTAVPGRWQLGQLLTTCP